MFHFKLSDAYYGIKQSHISMHLVNKQWTFTFNMNFIRCEKSSVFLLYPLIILILNVMKKTAVLSRKIIKNVEII